MGYGRCSMTRAPLPTRRQSITTTTEWNGHTIDVTVGFYPAADGFTAGTPGEIFADVKGQLGDTLLDAATLISVPMQQGLDL